MTQKRFVGGAGAASGKLAAAASAGANTCSCSQEVAGRSGVGGIWGDGVSALSWVCQWRLPMSTGDYWRIFPEMAV